MYPSFFDELTKLAAEETGTTKEKVLRSAVTAAPWAKRFGTSAIPAAVAANFLLPIQNAAVKSRVVAGIGLLGGGLGVGDMALRRWAQKHPQEGISKALKKEGVAKAFLKVAAMAGDLRISTFQGSKAMTNAPTEDSKQHAFKQLQNAQKPGEFTNTAKPRNLVAPGPSIKQVAALPTG